MKIVQKDVRFGFLGEYYSYSGDSAFNWGSSDVVQSDTDSNSTGYSSSWWFAFSHDSGHYYLGIRSDYYSARWPSTYNKDSNKVLWNVLQDGTYVSKDLPGYKTVDFPPSLTGKNIYSSSGMDYFRDCAVTIDGQSYTVRPMTIGYKNSSGSVIVNEAAGDQDEYYKYILCSDEANTTTWGNYVSIARKNTRSPSDYKLQLYRNSTNRSGTSGNEPVGDLANYVDIPNSSTSWYCQPSKFTHRLIAVPADHWVMITPESNDLGSKTAAFSFNVDLAYADGETIPDLMVSVGSKQVLNESSSTKGQRVVTIDQETFDSLDAGEQTITITAHNSSAHATTETVSFTKVDAFVSLESDPVSHDDMPTKCTLVKAEIVGTGATSQWWVTNNGNDESPVWEAYNGAGHVFANAAKSAEKWGVAWKCKIGGASATTRSELLKQVAMAVI